MPSIKCSQSAGKTRSDAAYVVATGCGRRRAGFAHEAVTEITCLAKGVNYLFPGARTIIDIGGQDTKAIRIDGRGRVVEFEMNDKCAAGTGRFLEVMATALKIDLERMGELSLKHGKDLAISSICTVFAESEVISLVSEGEKLEDILYGINMAIADRTMGLVNRLGGLEEEVVMAGGVAKNTGVVAALGESTGVGPEDSRGASDRGRTRGGADRARESALNAYAINGRVRLGQRLFAIAPAAPGRGVKLRLIGGGGQDTGRCCRRRGNGCCCGRIGAPAADSPRLSAAVLHAAVEPGRAGPWAIAQETPEATAQGPAQPAAGGDGTVASLTVLAALPSIVITSLPPAGPGSITT